MRTLTIALGLGLAALLAALWATGGLHALTAAAVEAQKSFQTEIARLVRALQAGEPGAVRALVAAAFVYGVLHAAGPGHGKFLIGAYGVARRVPMARLAAVALASSLAQALVAVLLVHGGLWLFGLTRQQMTGAADGALQTLSYALIAALGLWILWRGAMHLRALRPAAHDHAHDHGHDHGHHHHDHGPGCGHAHLPAPDEIARAAGWRETAALIGAVAIRPCTGALFLLILTAQLGFAAAGIAGTVAMGLGTAALTIGVAALSVTMREGALASLANTRGLAIALPVAEVLAGGLIAAVAGSLLAASV